MGNNFVRLSELEGSTLANALPVFEVPTHLAIGDHLAVDVTRLGSIASWAGFYHDVALHGYNGEVTKTNVSVVASDSQGGAYAGGAATKQARLGEADFENEGGDFRHRTPLSIAVNISEAEQTINESRRPVRDAASWAPPIDRALRQSLREAAWNHLVKQPNGYEYFDLAIDVAVLGMFYSVDLVGVRELAKGVYNGSIELGGGTPLALAACGLSVVLELGAMDALTKLHYKRRGGPDYIYSAVPLFHVDRAAAVSVRTRMPSPLIKAIK